MKRLCFISILMLIVLLVAGTSIYATNTTIMLNGSSSVTLGSTNKIIVQLVSNSKIGGVMGIIEKSTNISNIKVTAKNGWNMMSYNEETGSFNMVKNEGAKNEEIIEIEYTVSNSEGTGNITIKDISASDIENYDEENLDNVIKEISIVKEQEEPKEDTDDDNKDEEQQKNEEKEEASKDKEKEISKGEDKKTDTNQSLIKTNNNQIIGKSESTTAKNSSLPRTGIVGVIIPIVALLLGGISVCTYLGYKKYKGIN